MIVTGHAPVEDRDPADLTGHGEREERVMAPSRLSLPALPSTEHLATALLPRGSR